MLLIIQWSKLRVNIAKIMLDIVRRQNQPTTLGFRFLAFFQGGISILNDI